MKTSITPQQFEEVHRLGEERIRAMGITGEEFQKIVIEASGDYLNDLQALMQKRVKKYRQTLPPKSHILARKPFDPKKFENLGESWSITERLGRREGAIVLDTSKIIIKDYLERGEASITGGELLRRIKANSSDIQLGAADFLALWEEEAHVTLYWLHARHGITFLSFWDDILLRSDGLRFVLFLSRHGDGSWHWSCIWVDHTSWRADAPSGLLAS